MSISIAFVILLVIALASVRAPMAEAQLDMEPANSAEAQSLTDIVQYAPKGEREELVDALKRNTVDHKASQEDIDTRLTTKPEWTVEAIRRHLFGEPMMTKKLLHLRARPSRVAARDEPLSKPAGALFAFSSAHGESASHRQNRILR